MVRFFIFPHIPPAVQNWILAIFLKWRIVILYSLVWVAIFLLARLGFLLANQEDMQHAGIAESFKSVWYGLRMDASMGAYLTIPVILMLVAGALVRLFQKPAAYKIYTYIIFSLLLLSFITDIGIYKAWGSRLDTTPLKYLAHPKEAYASIANLPLVWIAILFLVLLLGGSRFFSWFWKKQSFELEANGKPIATIISLLLLGGLYIIPLRGGLQLAPMNQSAVYYSSENFANLAAINAPWNFVWSLQHNPDKGSHEYDFMPLQEVEAWRSILYTGTGSTAFVVDSVKTPKPNLVLIVWESLTAKIVNSNYEGKAITPEFNNLMKEGIYFSNIYASGDRTDKGIVAVLSGYPAQPRTSIVKMPSKAHTLPMLSKELAARGWKNYFYYGGELEFANIKAYLLQGKFDKFVSINNFSKKDQNSKWGAHDGVVAERLSKDISSFNQPFFCTWLTLSSHEPFEVPAPDYFPGMDDTHQFLNAHHYTDSCVNNFINFAKSQDWWGNTIIAIVADHGHKIPRVTKKEEDFKIPMLLLGGALTSTAIRQYAGGQVDLPATLWSQIIRGRNPFPYSKNLLDSSTSHWGYFSYNDGFGFFNDQGGFVYDNTGKRIIEERGEVTDSLVQAGKSVLQDVMSDYFKR